MTNTPPDRAIALPREEDEHGPGQVTHLVRSAGPVLDLSSDMAVLLEAETVRRKAGSSAP